MTNAQAVEAIRELMQKYDTYIAKWVEQYGTKDGFGEWFTAQVYRKH